MWSQDNTNQDNFVTWWNLRLTYLEMIIRSREHFLTSLRHIDAFPSFVFVFQKGVCARECWNKEETPRMNPKVLPDNWLVSLSVTRNTNESSIKAVSVLRHCSKDPEQGSFLFVGAAPCCAGPGMRGIPRGASAVGGRAGVRGPDGCQGNICSTSWLGLISRKCCHTHTGREKNWEKRGILCRV